MLEPLGQLGLPGQDEGEQIAVVLLHIRQQPQALQIDRTKRIGLVDENQGPFPQIGRLEKQLVELFQQGLPSPGPAGHPPELADDLPQQLGKSQVRIRDKGDPEGFGVQRAQDDPQRHRLADAHVAHHDRQTLVSFLDGKQHLGNGVFHRVVHLEVHLRVRHIVERTLVHVPVFVVHGGLPHRCRSALSCPAARAQQPLQRSCPTARTSGVTFHTSLIFKRLNETGEDRAKYLFYPSSRFYYNISL